MSIFKKTACVLLIVTVILAFSACSGADGGGTNLTGSAEEVLTALNEAIAASGTQTPALTPPAAFASDVAQNTVGLTVADYDKYVTSAAMSMAAIGTFAHEIAVIEAKDAASAAEVKKLISSEGGFNPQKWICVQPDKVVVVESGNYVLLAAAASDVCAAAVTAFEEAGGSVGEANVFFEALR
jgi:hypothetical protein